MHESRRFLVVLSMLLIGCTRAQAAPPPPTTTNGSRFAQQHDAPILLDGAHLEIQEEHPEKARVAHKVNLPTPGVWYVWLKVNSIGDMPAVLTYDMDGKQKLLSSRREILIQPYLSGQWLNHTRYPGFRVEVHADEPGEHEIGINLKSGEVEIQKIAMTLFHSARPAGDTLDHSGDPAKKKQIDPGLGRTTFPLGQLRIDGYRKDWKSPDVSATGQSYYIDSEKGSDESDGRSAEKAWKTFAHANATTFQPGDAILLKRGGQWKGGLLPRGSGTADKWITIAAYGQGDRPHIDGQADPGVGLKNQSYWIVQDLEVSNNPEFANSGIEIASKKGQPQPRGIKIFNCIAFDTGQHGIQVGAEDESNGYDGVTIENCLSFCNAKDGIVVSGQDQNGCKNSVIRYCTAYSNPGMAGIWIASGQNGLIERCLAYNNACVNIWTWNSINVTIRECEAFRGRPGRDAGGFDIDWGCEACLMESCYSHHNEGVGFLVMGSGTKPYRGFPVESRFNVMRYCVSEYDNPGIGVTGTLQQTLIHNNTIYTYGPEHTALSVDGWPELPTKWTGGGWPSECTFLNNILVVAGGATPLLVDHLAATQGNVFDHNLYWRADGKAGPMFIWGGNKSGDPEAFWKGKKTTPTPPQKYDTLAEFTKATGQEKNGVEADPKLADLGEGGYGRMALPAYRVQSGSPAMKAGANVTLDEKWFKGRTKYLTDTGAAAMEIPMEPRQATRDYWGDALPTTGPIAIGADEPTGSEPQTAAEAQKP